ncbi:cupin domain-containing protein [Ulvibacterium sp.]|uniref:cupin domain-containing protein n=1 Tax=Ulvibacterium sp. TaxID=2665914 RepID=UPI00261FEE77|nr:cupin domain-containing protein [Ulvibacterium sp.]
MYEIREDIKTQPYHKLQIQRLSKNNAVEVLSISLEGGTIFPEHTSPSDALLVILKGDVDFHIDQNTFHLTEQEYFSFPRETPHWVKANENSKFLIIR